jgi:hypothetical protein
MIEHIIIYNFVDLRVSPFARLKSGSRCFPPTSSSAALFANTGIGNRARIEFPEKA